MPPEDILRLIVDILGYMGMALVLLAMLMKDIHWLRFINIIGSSFSLTYGICTRTWPTAILNAALILINLSFPIRWYIVHRVRNKEGDAPSDPPEPEEPKQE